MLSEDQARSLRAVVASRHSTTEERAAAQARLDAATVRSANTDTDDDVRVPSEAEKAKMRTLLGGLAGEFAPTDQAPAPKSAEPEPPRHTPPPAVSAKQTPPPVVDLEWDDPETIARNQALTERHARLRAQHEGTALVFEARIPSRNTTLLLQPSDQAELDNVFSKQKIRTIECAARGEHRPENCECLETAFEFYRYLQINHDSDSPLLLGTEHVLIPSAERFARLYKTPTTEDGKSDIDWSAVWQGIYSRRRIA